MIKFRWVKSPALNALDSPLLAILGPDDESIDSKETELILREFIAQGRDISLILYPGYKEASQNKICRALH